VDVFGFDTKIIGLKELFLSITLVKFRYVAHKNYKIIFHVNINKK